MKHSCRPARQATPLKRTKAPSNPTCLCMCVWILPARLSDAANVFQSASPKSCSSRQCRFAGRRRGSTVRACSQIKSLATKTTLKRAKETTTTIIARQRPAHWGINSALAIVLMAAIAATVSKPQVKPMRALQDAPLSIPNLKRAGELNSSCCKIFHFFSNNKERLCFFLSFSLWLHPGTAHITTIRIGAKQAKWPWWLPVRNSDSLVSLLILAPTIEAIPLCPPQRFVSLSPSSSVVGKSCCRASTFFLFHSAEHTQQNKQPLVRSYTTVPKLVYVSTHVDLASLQLTCCLSIGEFSFALRKKQQQQQLLALVTPKGLFSSAIVVRTQRKHLPIETCGFSSS